MISQLIAEPLFQCQCAWSTGTFRMLPRRRRERR